MKTYGPFKAEDIASLPVENAKILIKQGLAERVEA
jgi:DNA replication initiation complex subunit (GINS family)